MQIKHENIFGKPLSSDCEFYVISYLNRHSEQYKLDDLIKSFGRLLNILGEKNIISEGDVREIMSGDSAE